MAALRFFVCVKTSSFAYVMKEVQVGEWSSGQEEYKARFLAVLHMFAKENPILTIIERTPTKFVICLRERHGPRSLNLLTDWRMIHFAADDASSPRYRWSGRIRYPAGEKHLARWLGKGGNLRYNARGLSFL